MSETKWSETKREYEVNEAGVPVLKKFTSEPVKKGGFERKDRLDLFFRSIGLLAIAVPIYLVSVQQRAGIRSQRALQQSDLYVNTSTELKSIVAKPVNSDAFQKSRDKLSNELFPKISFLFNEDIVDRTETIIEEIPLYVLVASTANDVDLLYKQNNAYGSYLLSYRNSAFEPVHLEQEQLNDKKIIDSVFQEFIFKKNEINKWANDTTIHNKELKNFATELAALHTKYNACHSKFKNGCQNVVAVLEQGNPGNAKEIEAPFQSLDNAMGFLRVKTSVHLSDSLKALQEKFLQSLQLQFKELLFQMRKSNKLLDV